MERRSDTLSESLYKGAKGIIVAYDVTDRDSFDKVHHWLGQALKLSGKHISIILVGNKADLDEMREVTTDEGGEIAK